MAKPACASCAFTTGAEANLEPHNFIRAQLCLLGAIPFYCHHGADGTLRDVGSVTRAEQRVAVQTGFMVICQGWRREVNSLARSGYYARSAKSKRVYAELGLGALQIFTTTEDGERKEWAAETLEDILLALYKERGYVPLADETAGKESVNQSCLET
jgi:hypothetical protein